MREKKVVKINRFDNMLTDTSNRFEIKATKYYNYIPSNVLSCGKGMKSATFPSTATNPSEAELRLSELPFNKVLGLTYFRFKSSTTAANTFYHRLLILGDDNYIYINQLLSDMYDCVNIYNLTFDTPPLSVSYMDEKENAEAIVLFSENKMVKWVSGYSPEVLKDVPILTSVCMHEDSLYYTIKEDPYVVWATDHLRLKEIGEKTIYSRKLSLGFDLGKAGKVVNFKDNLYVIREYGISKVTRAGDNFTVTEEYHSNTKIYVNTVCVCGDRLFFMTNNGLFYFTGYNVSKSKVKFINTFPISNTGAIAKALGDKYYLALKVDFGDDILDDEKAVNNALFIVDTNDFSYEVIRGVDIATMLPVTTETFEKMLFTFNTGPVDKIGEMSSRSALMDLPLLKYWASDRVVESLIPKMFTKLTVSANTGVEFKLIFDNKSINFTTIRSGNSEFHFKEISRNVKIEISSMSADAEVDAVEIEYYEG